MSSLILWGIKDQTKVLVAELIESIYLFEENQVEMLGSMQIVYEWI